MALVDFLWTFENDDKEIENPTVLKQPKIECRPLLSMTSLTCIHC